MVRRASSSFGTRFEVSRCRNPPVRAARRGDVLRPAVLEGWSKVAGQERRRARQSCEGAQGARVVLTVNEQIAVLQISIRWAGTHPSFIRPYGTLRIVEQPPPGAIEQSGMERLEAVLARGAGGSGSSGGQRRVRVCVPSPDPSPERIGRHRDGRRCAGRTDRE